MNTKTNKDALICIYVHPNRIKMDQCNANLISMLAHAQEPTTSRWFISATWLLGVWQRVVAEATHAVECTTFPTSNISGSGRRHRFPAQIVSWHTLQYLKDLILFQ
jgi:hypothetical protein